MSASNMLSAQQQQYNYNMSSGPQSMGGQGMYQWSGQGGKCAKDALYNCLAVAQTIEVCMYVQSCIKLHLDLIAVDL